MWCMHEWNRFASARLREALVFMPVNLVVGIYPIRIWAWRDGLRRISFGMFPIVRYIGYAVFSRNGVNCVLSVETRSGMMVAPGRWDSSDSCYTESVGIVCGVLVAHLYHPPPVTCMHLIIDAGCASRARIMPLRSEDKIPHKLRITIKRADAFNNIPAVKFKVLASNDKFLAPEGRSPRQFVVNDIVQFVYRAV